MLDRNRRIKRCPERFQDCSDRFDIIITVEERVYDQVLEHMDSIDAVDNRPVHVFNVDIEDNHEEALMGAFLIADMINMVKITFLHATFQINSKFYVVFFNKYHKIDKKHKYNKYNYHQLDSASISIEKRSKRRKFRSVLRQSFVKSSNTTERTVSTTESRSRALYEKLRLLNIIIR